MRLRVVTRSGKVLLEQVEVSNDGSDRISKLNKEIHSRFPKLTPSRQRLTYGIDHQALDKDKSCSQYGLKDGDVIYLKDLGKRNPNSHMLSLLLV
jgi:hypothetical protein